VISVVGFSVSRENRARSRPDGKAEKKDPTQVVTVFGRGPPAARNVGANVSGRLTTPVPSRASG
jgi:hypothetical protein